MTLREEIIQALADVPGSNRHLWVKSVLDPAGPERPVHIFWFLHRYCWLVECEDPTATAFDAFLIQASDWGIFIRCVENKRQIDAAINTLKRLYCKKDPRCASESSSPSPTSSGFQETP